MGKCMIDNFTVTILTSFQENDPYIKKKKKNSDCLYSTHLRERGALYELSIIINFDVSKPPYIIVD